MTGGAGRRWVTLASGIVVAAIGFAFTLRSELGLGPWHVVQQGLSQRLGITIGTAVVVVNVVLLLVSMRMGERPGVGTLAIVGLLGPAVDGALAVIGPVHGGPERAAALVAGLLVMTFGGSLMISARLGVSPIDALMVATFRRLRAVSLSSVRIAQETFALGLGWALGGTVGVGTVLIGAGVGPLLGFWLRLLGTTPQRVEGLPSLEPAA